jgi:poly(3-hydroxybutyrate) depolymerase
MKMKTSAKLLCLASALLLHNGSTEAQQAGIPRIERLEHQNFDRTFIVYLPSGYTPEKQRPLFINMHGFTSNKNQQMTYSGFNATAEEKDCIVVYPDGVQNRWNSGTNFGVSSGVDDVGFLSKLIDRMILLYNADPSQVYSTGYSAGGFMSYRLACERTNRVTAIAPIVASIVEDTYRNCRPARPISVIAFNGTADAVTAYGGFPGNFRPVEEVIRFWAGQNNCNTEPTLTDLPNIVQNDNSTVTKVQYENCDAGTEVVLMRINNGGHTWSGSSVPGVGNTNQDIKANDEMYEFCTRFRIPDDLFCNAPANLKSTWVPGTEATYELSWDNVENNAFFSIALIDSTNRIIVLDSLTETSYIVSITSPNDFRWSVKSECESGHANWARPSSFRVSTNTQTKIANTLSIYPNPSKQQIRIDGINAAEQQALSIYDASGKLVRAALYNNSSFIEIDISKFAAGNYWISINDRQSGQFTKLK